MEYKSIVENLLNEIQILISPFTETEGNKSSDPASCQILNPIPGKLYFVTGSCQDAYQITAC
jgi:hypothetical protein